MTEHSNSVRFSMVFVRVAQALIGTREALPKKLRPHDVRRIMEASNFLYAASAWLRFCAGELHTEFVPRMASEAYHILGGMKQLGSVELAAQVKFWEKVTNVIATLNSVVVGQRPEAFAVAHAAQLCIGIGEHLRQLQLASVGKEDD